MLVADRHRWPRALWLALLLVAAWVNLHGSSVVGLVLLVATPVEDRRDRAALRRDQAVLAAAAAASLPESRMPSVP